MSLLSLRYTHRMWKQRVKPALPSLISHLILIDLTFMFLSDHKLTKGSSSTLQSLCSSCKMLTDSFVQGIRNKGKIVVFKAPFDIL